MIQRLQRYKSYKVKTGRFMLPNLTSQDLPLGLPGLRIDLPEPCSAQKCIAIMSALDSLRQFIEFFSVAAAEDHVIGNERFFQLDERVLDVAPPSLFTEPRQTRFPKVIFDDAAVTIWQIAQFQRKHVIAPHQGGAQACAESEKKHSAAMITAERLHGCVVDDANRFAKCFFEIESNPTVSKMFRLAYDLPVAYGRRETHRDRVEFPITDQRFDLRHHRARRQLRPGFEFSFSRARNHQLHVRAADVDDQDFSVHHDCFVVAAEGGLSAVALAKADDAGCGSVPGSVGAAGLSLATVIGINLSARNFFFEPVIFFARSRETSRKCHCACARGSEPSGFKRR